MSNRIKSEEWNLLDSYMKGDRESGHILFSQIYLPLKAFVFNRALSIGLNADDCSDIIAESMKRALEKIHYYSGDSPFKNYVIGFANNILKEKKREIFRGISKVIAFDEISESVIHSIDTSMDPLLIISEKEKLIFASRAFTMLSKDHQDILRLRLFNELKVKQICELTGKSESAIESMYRRAIIALKENYKKLEK